MKRGIAVALACLAPAAKADAPPEAPRAVQRVCSLNGRACATIDRRAGVITVRPPGDAHAWTVRANPPGVAVANDGQRIVELYRPGGLLDAGDVTDTLIYVARARGGGVRRVTLGQLVPRPDRLSPTASHRQFERVAYFDRRGGYRVETAEGRLISIDPVAGRVMTVAVPGGASADWRCRYSERSAHCPKGDEQPEVER